MGNSLILEKRGVRQGSAHLPFLFLSYINDLPGICGKDTDLALFGDDLSLIKSGKREATNLNGELERGGHWFRQNKLLPWEKLGILKLPIRNCLITIVSRTLVFTLTISSHPENTLRT